MAAAAGTAAAAAGTAAAWRGGPVGGVWHPGYWNGGAWYSGWWGPAVAAARRAHRGRVIPLGRERVRLRGPCVQVRPLYAPNGAWIGNGPVNVCQ